MTTRIARLGPQAIRLARAVAVLGPAAQLRQAARLAELPLRTAAELVDQLTREAIIGPRHRLEFVHPLVRAAVYADSADVLRAADHKRAALILHSDGADPTALAPHLLAAEPWVVDTLSAAATTAPGQGAPEPAAAFLARAIAEPPTARSQQRELTAALGRALGMANRPDEAAAAALRSGIELADRPEERADIALELVAHAHNGRGRDALQALELARAAIDSDEPDLPLRLRAGLRSPA